MSDDAKPAIVISDKIVSWILSLSIGATTMFFGWLAYTVIETRSTVDHMGEQLNNIRETRGEAVAIVVEQIKHLSFRLDRLEETVRERDKKR